VLHIRLVQQFFSKSSVAASSHLQAFEEEEQRMLRQRRRRLNPEDQLEAALRACGEERRTGLFS